MSRAHTRPSSFSSLRRRVISSTTRRNIRRRYSVPSVCPGYIDIYICIYLSIRASILQSNVIYEADDPRDVFNAARKPLERKSFTMTNNVHTATVKNGPAVLTKRLPLNRVTDAIRPLSCGTSNIFLSVTLSPRATPSSSPKFPSFSRVSLSFWKTL